MRQRNKPWADEMIAANPQYLIPDPANYRGKWADLFGNDCPIHIEIGTGKGQFIYGMAQQHPEINYIGIEISKKVIITALQKLVEHPLPNIKLLMVNAENLTDYFAQGEVALLYLNFSDPWPKTRHEKRRLTNKRFLNIYQKILPKQGEIHFKTDNRNLFEYSLMSFNAYGMQFRDICLDLHQSDYLGNIMTEYEQKFSAKGHPIYRCEVQYK